MVTHQARVPTAARPDGLQSSDLFLLLILAELVHAFAPELSVLARTVHAISFI
jgi:hypothetical protein